MRLMIDMLIGVLAIAVLSTMLLAQHRERREVHEFDRAHRALASMHQQLLYQAALGEVRLTANGFPERLDPAWFGEELPVNPLAPPPDWAWVDLAPAGDHQDHPPDPVLTDPGQAGLWYNANRGVVRLRVPDQLSRRRTLELYNELNNSALEALPARAEREHRAAAETLHAMPGVHARGPARPENDEPEAADTPAPASRRSLRQPDG
ncbi:MAG: hypothetical protein WD009_14525 [Phycisphaeraceae bacterium]